MPASLLNFWLDAALFLVIAFVVWVSAVLQMVFPAPTQAADWKLWGWSYNEWRDVQFTAICVFAMLAIEHVVLHWKWICGIAAVQVLHSKTRPDEANQAVLGVGIFITILLFMLAGLIAASLSIQPP